MKEQLIKIKNAFGIKGEIVSFTRVGNGNVNDTYCVVIRDVNQKKYVFQRLNSEAFENPDVVMENAVSVTKILKQKHIFEQEIHYYEMMDNNSETDSNENNTHEYVVNNQTVSINKSCDKKISNQEEQSYKPQYLLKTGKYHWRVFDYIDSVTCNKTEDYHILEESGRAFGRFIKALSDENPVDYEPTIINFHNTKIRYEKLYKALETDMVGRSHQIQEEVKWLRSVERKACWLTEMHLDGELPLRITHNDTKTNNVLFDIIQKKAISVIDLDTVMPGLVATDFGDGVRYAAGYPKELNDEAGPLKEQMEFRFDLFQAYAKGFISEVKNIITKTEFETLYLGPFAMAVELATRYLEDYLNGDRYFHISESDQNLIKARQQISLAKEMEKSEERIKEYIKTLNGVEC